MNLQDIITKETTVSSLNKAMKMRMYQHIKLNPEENKKKVLSILDDLYDGDIDRMQSELEQRKVDKPYIRPLCDKIDDDLDTIKQIKLERKRNV